ncbi:DUF5777 family beta-barrel protein [uncultured Mucilaginibacter sp.]|uniref:DUF5777 family beta-barrel protein n=1 Tax=uncultured Mucilaginibacter sp. TaxID=797541 RepID=UPI0025E4A890|nr:DUF5777 family beta-barrel protein [uncultured Mucilaginibacter sp.]
MKKHLTYSSSIKGILKACVLIVLSCSLCTLMAQDSTATAHGAKKKGTATKTVGQKDTAAATPAFKKNPYVKNTFEGNYIIDNQTVMVPIKGTFEFVIQHRFGTVNNGFSDLFGLFFGANIMFSFNYVPLNNLQLGFAVTNENMMVDWNLKYALLKQTKDGSVPVSITYYGNVAMDTRKKDSTNLFSPTADRFSYYSEIIIARKFSDKFSLQVSPNLSAVNNSAGYVDVNGNQDPKWNGVHFAVAVSGRYKISDGSAIIANYDQPLAQQPGNIPRPYISFGLEFKTSGHDFEVFFGNYSSLLPQNNNLYNPNDFAKGQFLIGFNISRLWNF